MTNNNFKDTINDLLKNALKEVVPNMTINDKNPNVQSEKEVEATIQEALNANREDSVISASLDGFNLKEIKDGYLAVGHRDIANIVELGIVSKNEYEHSLNKSALLQTIVKDCFTRIASQLPTEYKFAGSFVEPVIEKVARGCDQCEAAMINGVFCHETGCPKGRAKKPCFECGCTECDGKCMEGPEVEAASKQSWLTDTEFDTELPMAGAEFMEYECPVCKETFEDFDLNQHDKLCPGTPEVMQDKPAISIKEDLPLAHASDSLAQSMQAEQQNISASQEKIKTEAVNALVAMLQGMGHGSSKVAEVTESKTGYDVMVTVDADSALRAVSIPVEVKASKVVLPKKTLVSELISKGLDINAKLAESFSQEVLVKMAEADEKAAFEKAEAEAIINEKVASLDKVAGNEPSSQYFGTNEVVYLNKHLIPENITDLEIGDTVHIDGAGYRLVSKTKDALSRGEDDGSTWVFEKVTAISK
jgi:hypothetical protein